jgi:hypothetical protein
LGPDSQWRGKYSAEFWGSVFVRGLQSAPALISAVWQSGQLYSIPEPAKQGLVATESVGRALRESGKEMPMDNSLKQTVRRVCNWLNKKHVLLICLLSVVHIGLSCIHTRDSGRADHCTQGHGKHLHFN